MEKRQLMVALTVQIKNADMGLISFAAAYAFKDYKEEEFLRELYDQLKSLELGVVTRERLGDELSDKILDLFN